MGTDVRRLCRSVGGFFEHFTVLPFRKIVINITISEIQREYSLTHIAGIAFLFKPLEFRIKYLVKYIFLKCSVESHLSAIFLKTRAAVLAEQCDFKNGTHFYV